MNRSVLLLALLVTACGEDAADDVIVLTDAEPTIDAAPIADAAPPAEDAAPLAEDAAPLPDAAPPPPFVAPTIEGVPVAEDENPDPDIVEVTLEALVDKVDIDGELVSAYLYNRVLPGPMIQAKVGDEVIVHFTNRLSEPTTIHWHGLRISDEMDGNPRIQNPVQPGESFEYRFVVHDAGTFWYHPHVRANEQVEKGLYGTIVVHDPADPVFDAERYLVIDDLLLDENNRYPPFLATHPEVMHGRYGNILLANGAVAPMAMQSAQGRVERWRLVNTANARTFYLRLIGARFKVVGTDGGRLEEPYVTDQLRVAVGQRYDLEVTYDAAGEVRIDALVAVLDELGNVVDRPFPLYVVDAAPGEAPRAIEWAPMAPAAPRSVDREETMVFDAVQDPVTGVRWRINGEANRMEPIFTFTQGQTVRMRLTNRAGPEHPFHLHGQFFRIVEHPFNLPTVGLKDTVLVPGQNSVEIEAYFDNPGRWMAHCHILAHAELGMMSEIVVEPAE